MIGIWRRILCTFSPRTSCGQWKADGDETIRYLRVEKQAAEEAAAKIRRSHSIPDPITRVYGGWDREERKR